MDKFYHFESNYGIIALSCKNNALNGCKILSDFDAVFKNNCQDAVHTGAQFG